MRRVWSQALSESYCFGILSRDGAFADYVSLPEKNLLEVPEGVSTDEAVFAEPLAAAFQILEQVDVTQSMRVAVIGDGRLGFLCAQVLAMTGCQLRVIGKHSAKLNLFEQAGIETEMPHRRLERDCDLVVDCTGSNSGMETAYQLVKPKGTIVLKTTVAGTPTFSLAPLVIDEIRVIGSRCGLFPPAIKALEERAVAVTPLITRRYPIEAAIEAFESCKEPGTMKVLFDISDE